MNDAELLHLLGEIGRVLALGYVRDADHALRQLRADPMAPAQLLARVQDLELRSRSTRREAPGGPAPEDGSPVTVLEVQ